MTYDIGFLGGGQLARMSIMAAQRMGLKCVSLDPGEDTPASQVADSLVGRLDDAEAVARLARRCQKLTLENEFIPANVVPEQCLPSPTVLATIQDKFLQRQAYARFGAPTPRAVLASERLAIGFPLIAKARFGGYDGKGTKRFDDAASFEAWASEMGDQINTWLVEDLVPFRRELAVMVARSETETVCFPTMETVQTNHVCDLVFPAGVDASQVAVQAVEAVNGVGLFGVELFELPDGSCQINEIAPRPHNTGHYTLDWGGISQFEAHVRLVMGWPMPQPVGQPTCMANLLGNGDDDFQSATRRAMATVPEAHIHWYGKAECKPGRKMGHINVVGENCVELARAARQAFLRA